MVSNVPGKKCYSPLKCRETLQATSVRTVTPFKEAKVDTTSTTHRNMANVKAETQPDPESERERSTVDTDRGEEKAQSDATKLEFDAPPDGGFQAWLVTLGAAFILFSALGFANTFGVFQEYYMTHQLRGQSPDDIAWIGSLAAFLQFAVGVVAGPAFDRFGSWVRLRVG